MLILKEKLYFCLTYNIKLWLHTRKEDIENQKKRLKSNLKLIRHQQEEAGSMNHLAKAINFTSLLATEVNGQSLKDIMIDIIKQRVHITQMGGKVLNHARGIEELLHELNDTVSDSTEDVEDSEIRL